MAEYNSYEPFSVCFNMLKMRYRDYDEALTRLDFLQPTDKVNVFINVESILRYLSTIQDLENKLRLYRDHDALFVSCFLNLVGHYKSFFINNGLDTKIYLFCTDLDSTEFPQMKYNEDFRSYYMIKYTDNPRYIYLTDALKNRIVPDVRTIIDFVPNAYFVTSKNIDGSVIPMVIAESDPSRKNIIIGSELCDTQYSLIPNFVNHLVKRGHGTCKIMSTVPEYIAYYSKSTQTGLEDYCQNYSIYVGLLSVLGDKSRSIDGIPGVGFVKYERMLTEAFRTQIVNADSVTPEIISGLFKTTSNEYDDTFASTFIENFYSLSIQKMFDELSPTEKKSILTQITDHVDITGLTELNKSKFFNHPLILESLAL